jgi:hypothetical protein
MELLSNSTAGRDRGARRAAFPACSTRSLAQPMHGNPPVLSGGSHVPGQESTGLKWCIAVIGPGGRGRSRDLPSSLARGSPEGTHEGADDGGRRDRRLRCPSCDWPRPIEARTSASARQQHHRLGWPWGASATGGRGGDRLPRPRDGAGCCGNRPGGGVRGIIPGSASRSPTAARQTVSTAAARSRPGLVPEKTP